MNKFTIYLAAAVLACLVITSSARPGESSSEEGSRDRGRKGEFIHSTCLVKNATETLYEAPCGDANLECVVMKHRRDSAERPKRHAIFRELDISICMCKNCTTDADCADGVKCNTSCGMCAVPKERMAYASACQRNGEEVKQCPSYKHCAASCARNVTFKGEQYLLAQCHPKMEKSSSSSSSSSSEDGPGSSSSDSSSHQDGSGASSSQSSSEEDAAEELEDGDGDTNQLLEDAERELLSLLED